MNDLLILIVPILAGTIAYLVAKRLRAPQKDLSKDEVMANEADANKASRQKFFTTPAWRLVWRIVIATIIGGALWWLATTDQESVKAARDKLVTAFRTTPASPAPSGAGSATPAFDAIGAWFSGLWTDYVVDSWAEAPLVFMSKLLGELAALSGVPVWLLYIVVYVAIMWLVVRPLFKIVRGTLSGNSWLTPTVVIIGALGLVYYSYNFAEDSAMRANPAVARAHAEDMIIYGDELASGDHVYNIMWNQTLVFDPPASPGATGCFTWDPHANDSWNDTFQTPKDRRYYVVYATTSEKIMLFIPSLEEVERYEFTDEFERN